MFDLDGTLVDSAPDIASSLDAALAQRRLPPLGPKRVRSIIGDGVVSLARRAFSLHGVSASDEDIAGLVTAFRAIYREHLCDQTRPYAGIPELLDGLACRPLAVLTNKPGDAARTLLARLALADRFARVVGDNDGFPRKPAPDALLAIAGALGVVPGSTLYVGDAPLDIATGRAAATRVGAALWGYTPRAKLVSAAPDFLLEHPLDVLRLDGSGDR